MKWILYVFSYSIVYFIFSFVILLLFFGGYSLYYSKVKYGVFELYTIYGDVFLCH